MNQSNDTTRRVFLMSLPIFAELLLQLLVGNVDQIMVSRYAQSSVAAIGNGNQLISLVIILLNAMSAATTILLSQSLGARDSKRAAEVCNASVVILGLSSLLATALLIGFHRPLFVWLRVSEEVMAEACAYTVLVGSFTLVQGLYMTFTAILRSYSMLREVMLASLVMNGVNIFGNALLINGMFGLPALGVVGAAISTNLSKCVGLALVMLLYRKKIGVPLSIFRARAFSR
ncbi:MAG: MATE family efflux transporter, partial [Oscillospiraceae bacterium]